jgi:hypothetical protein
MDSSLAGGESALFGERFPYPCDGKTVLLDIARQFAKDVNEAAIKRLKADHGDSRASQWLPLDVTSAYPTARQHCPRIAILRLGSTNKPTGVDLDWHEEPVQLPGRGLTVRKFSGLLVNDQLEAAICCTNERLRDDLHIWFQQYCLDATLWALPQLRTLGFYQLSCTNAADDQVEYQGTQSQPGFEFYVSRLTFAATYDLSVVTDVDQLQHIFSWENFTAGGQWAGAAGEGLDLLNDITPPDRLYADNA